MVGVNKFLNSIFRYFLKIIRTDRNLLDYVLGTKVGVELLKPTRIL